jgi:hypothetical protein
LLWYPEGGVVSDDLDLGLGLNLGMSPLA